MLALTVVSRSDGLKICREVSVGGARSGVPVALPTKSPIARTKTIGFLSNRELLFPGMRRRLHFRHQFYWGDCAPMGRKAPAHSDPHRIVSTIWAGEHRGALCAHGPGIHPFEPVNE